MFKKSDIDFADKELPLVRSFFFKEDDDVDESEMYDGTGVKTDDPERKQTPVLDNFGVDLTKKAALGLLDPLVGREQEIERMSQILSRRKKNNPVLIGEPGVGKTAIVEGLALRIAQKKVATVLFDKRVVSLDIASLVAGTKYRGQFEERMKSLINELSNNKDVILFIDELHTILGAGSAAGSMDAANMLKPALARGELQCIGSTTLDEFRKQVEKDAALERRFQKILVTPTSAEQTYDILQRIKHQYEAHHCVYYTPEAIKACVSLSNRYISDRCLPDKAIDAMDEAGSRVHIASITIPEAIKELELKIAETQEQKSRAVRNQNYELAAKCRDVEHSYTQELELANKRWNEETQSNRPPVELRDIEQTIAMMSGIPVQRIGQSETAKLLVLGDTLKSKIIGQDEAVEKVVKAIRRNRVGLKSPYRPIGTFMFLGPTGVGKTHLVKLLVDRLFDSREGLIRVDMSEYMEKISVSRLIGSPPGYVGYDEGGQLTEQVRRKPYSVILLDEIEKAHSDVLNLLLQVMDEGMLTDSFGRKVDFKNTIIIMTSNVGSRQMKDFSSTIGFYNSLEKSKQYSESVVAKQLNKTFTPEFLNRIDEIITFAHLSQDDICKIIDLELAELNLRIQELGYKLLVTDRAKEYVARSGFDSNLGARPLKRAIQKYIEDNIAELVLQNTMVDGDTILIDLGGEVGEMCAKIVDER